MTSVKDGGFLFYNKILSLERRLLAASEVAGVYISNDDGNSWHPANNELFDLEVNDLMEFEGMIYAATAVGLHISLNSGETWKLTDGQPANLTYSSVRSLTVLDSVMLAGTRDNLFISKDTAQSWEAIVLPGREDESHGDLQFVTALGNVLVAAPDFGGGFISFDLGDSWSRISEIPANSEVESGIMIEHDLYLGTNLGLYNSTDDG